jgi:arsenite methyltransferase
MKQDNSIHESVKEHYSAIALSQSASCCSSSPNSSSACCETGCGTEVKLYDDVLLQGLPLGVTGLSLGCGDPVSIATLRAGETVLDLGSGAGIDCFLAARQVGESGTVIGVDMTPAMLQKANENKAKMAVQNVEFRKGQIEALPVDDNSIDVVISNCVINLSPDKLAVFREAFRVLKPRARVSISDIVTEGEFSPELQADRSRWAECITGAIDANAYIQLMQDAGFIEISVVDKLNADAIVKPQAGMPRIYSARISAYKPE